MKKYLASFFTVIILLSPLVSLAQGNVTVSYVSGNQSGVSCTNLEVESLQSLLGLATCILIKSLWPLLLTIAVIVFIIGVIKYIANGDDSGKREEGRNFILYGLVGLFVLVSVWGLVGVLQGTFGLESTPVIPQLQD
ncbi:MAG: hypothetical protein QG579_261 [Patescibacteria group bacterium]|nr:hypothetical protein [Patescibacteria group bacterium]